MKDLKTYLLPLVLTLLLTNPIAWANIMMHISPPSSAVNPNDIFSVDISLYNPTPSPFDAITIWLGFNPSYLEVQDADLGKTGIQIITDPLGTYSFDWNPTNTADNTTGLIDWRAGAFSDRTQTGTFARVNFKALSPVSSTPLTFKFDNTWPNEPYTKVLNDGIDVLGLSTDHTDGTVGATVTVVPEPGSIMLMGMGLLFLIRKSARYGRQKMHKKSK